MIYGILALVLLTFLAPTRHLEMDHSLTVCTIYPVPLVCYHFFTWYGHCTMSTVAIAKVMPPPPPPSQKDEGE